MILPSRIFSRRRPHDYLESETAIPVKMTGVRVKATILDMLCEEGQKLKNDLADASLRFSDSAPGEAKQILIAERLEVERLHLAQQEALSAFTRHIERCPVCSQQGS
jgi:hypothetical protein